MPFSLTVDGLTIALAEEIREEINEELRATFGNSIDLTDATVLGQLVGIFSERYSLLGQLLQAVNASMDPDQAVGANLDSLCALTGTVREAARRSTVTLTLTGTNATVVPTGSLASTPLDVQFETTEDATLATLTSWASSTAYTLGQRRTNAGRSYVVITAGTSAGSGGPTTTADDITDGTVHWRYLGEGAAADDAEAQATLTGPLIAASGDITTIDSPVSGWESVINLLDADVGADEETDAVLRLRRDDEITEPGTSTVDAIRAALLAIDGVTAVTMFVNNTDTTDPDGMPPHSVEALVRGGDDQDIYDTLLANVAAGIQTYGTETGTAEDSEGIEHTMMFSRPDEIEIWVDLEVLVDPDDFPEDGEDQIKQAIVDWGDLQKTGKDAVASAIAAQAFTVAGMLDVTDIDIDDAPAPTGSATVPIARRELAVYDTSRITVVVTEGTP